jgi:hypothetical protein
MKLLNQSSSLAPKSTYIRIVASIIPLLIISVFFGCGSPRKAVNLTAGSIVLSRPAPLTSSLSSAPLGFLPLSNSAVNSKPSLVIDKTAKTLTLTNGTSNRTIPVSFSNFSLNGTVSIAHKQKKPVWYASDEYFVSRNLAIPAEGHADRYLRGALGNKALFLDQKNAIFASPVSGMADSPVSGIMLASSDLELIFDEVPVGTEIVLK